MKKIHNKIFIITDTLYNVDLEIVVGDYEFYQKHLNNKYSLEKTPQKYYGGVNHFLVGEIGKGKDAKSFAVNVLWLPLIDWCTGFYVSLSHEILHACIQVMSSVGIKIDVDNHEALNYYHDFLYGNALQKLLKYSRSK